MKILILSVILNTSVIVFSLKFGKCPELPVIKNFDKIKFSGQWFEIERSFYLLEITASCTHINFTLNTKGWFDVETLSVNKWTGTRIFAHGIGLPLLDNSSVFRYKVNTKMPFSIAKFLPGAGVYKILVTDYDNYAILWYCSNLLFAYNDRIFVLGRSKEISEETRIHIYNTLNILKLDPNRLILSKNVNCTSS